jgi:glucose dehydrogenase
MTKASDAKLLKRVLEVLDYDPLTGIFINKIRRSNAMPGERAGNVGPNGYRTIMIDYKAYYAHHLAVLIMTGRSLPKKKVVDHDDWDRDGNWWDNLKVTNQVVNGHNRKGLNKNNTSGYAGVWQNKNGSFSAKIWFNKVPKQIGSNFPSVDSAVESRRAYLANLPIR